MELAVHLRNANQKDGLETWREHLAGLYDATGIGPNDWAWPDTPSFDRMYIGDEFCSSRMPGLTELEALLQLAREKKMAVTLLTSILTNKGMQRLSRLLECLGETHSAAEVVFNDWGVLQFLKERYPDFSLAAGRLLNKGFKDPRLSDANGLSLISNEADELLSTDSFDHVELQEKMIQWGVVRVERDMLPYRKPRPFDASKLEISLYFPFGYVTTGRVCWPATFDQTAKERFLPTKGCARPCERTALRLDAAGFSLPVIQAGNTIYYMYTPAMLTGMIEETRGKKIRLIYQGFAL